MFLVGSSETLRSVIDAGRSSKRLDELSSARVIGKIAMKAHAAQQKAGAGKAIGPLTPARVGLATNGEVALEPATKEAPGYSAPEQINGSAGDRRSDVFSLGAVMWEALTHQRLFDAMNDAAVRAAVLDREIQSPAEVNANIPAELSAICMRALSRNPADRYQSLKSMAVEIEEFLEEAGETDDDTKIAQYLATMPRKPASSSVAPAPTAPVLPAAQSSGSVAPLPVTPRPHSAAQAPQAAPSILTSEPARPKRNSGADLAAALATANTAPANGANGSASPAGLPQVGASSTAVGVPAAPVASEWQDRTPPAHVAPPIAPAAPPTIAPPIAAAAPGGTSPPAASEPVPLTPRPPILPSGSQTAMRADKGTLLVAVPPQVKVATVDAKHVEAKPQALVVDDPVESKAEEALAEEAKTENVAAAPAPKEDTKATLVDAAPPALLDAHADAKDAKDAEHAKDGGDTKKATDKNTVDIKTPNAGDDKNESGANPAAAVSLGPAPRDSKGDLLAGWGWGTGKHDAIAPTGYADYDDELAVPSSKKTLTYVIGGGLAAALLIVVVAFAAGGKDKKVSAKDKEREAEKAAAMEKAKRESEAAARIAAEEMPAPVEAGSAVGASAEPTAPVDPAAEKAALEKAAADKAAADKAAAEIAKAEEAERVRAEAALAKQSDAERKKAEAEADKIAEAQRKADAKRAEDEAKATDAAKKAEAKRLAQEDAARKKAEADAARAAKAEAAKTAARTAPKTDATAKRPEKTTTTAKTVATAEPKATKSDVSPEVAYRQGLQAFARGDTTAALASLRTSLAANPNYAPTWRGLGLVFEKMGEKAQAKSAYRRYLQLAPSAGDAEIIKGRLERLGT